MALFALLALLVATPGAHAMSAAERTHLRNQARQMFDHGFNNYMTHAFPQDELNPVTCKGRSRDADPNNWGVNDVLGNFSLTLVDSLDTLAIMGDRQGFERAVRLVIYSVSFDLDSRVQVFEVTIRVLGGLLSAHMLATDPKFGFKLDWYTDELLELARDLGNRLMPAFNTSTSMPFPRVNLRRGVLDYETPQSCTAGIGTLVLEFGVLSRLTGDPKYETAARTALWSLWDRRSGIDLVGNSINVLNSQWIESYAGIGAGIDSFYEYLLKAHILFGDPEYLSAFETSYKAVMNWISDGTGFIYKNVNMNDGTLATTWIDSLAAFFPGLQVLAGDVKKAVEHHYTYYTIWQRYGALPERFDLGKRDVSIPIYPLRPEFVESTYMLYQATRDPFYLDVGKRILEDIESACHVKCGYVALMDVRSGLQDDRMESFFLSETLKYLYLLFDEDNFVNKLDSNYVFTTEGHFLYLPRNLLTHQSAGKATCPVSNLALDRPLSHLSNEVPLSRSDADICHRYIGYFPPPPTSQPICSPRGLYFPSTQSTITNQGRRNTKGDESHQFFKQRFFINVPKRPNAPNIEPRFARHKDNLLVNTIEGQQLILEHSPNQESYSLVSLGFNTPVMPGRTLRVLESGVPFLHETVGVVNTGGRFDGENTLLPPPMHATIKITAPSSKHDQILKSRLPTRAQVVANVASFGPWLFHGMQMQAPIAPLLSQAALESLFGMHAVFGKRPETLEARRATLQDLDLACGPLSSTQSRLVHGRIVMVRRGSCPFTTKCDWLQLYGAVGVIIASEDDMPTHMLPADPITDSDASGRVGGVDTIDIPALFVIKSAASQLLQVISLGFIGADIDYHNIHVGNGGGRGLLGAQRNLRAHVHASIIKNLLSWSWNGSGGGPRMRQKAVSAEPTATITILDSALARNKPVAGLQLVVGGRPIENIEIVKHIEPVLLSEDDADLNSITRDRNGRVSKKWPTVRRIGWRGKNMLDPGVHFDCLEQCPARMGNSEAGRLACCARIHSA